MRKSGLIAAAFLVLSWIVVGGSTAAQASGSPTGPKALFTPRTLATQPHRKVLIPLQPSAPKLAAPPIACDGAYHVMASPNGTGHNDLFATSALSASDVWAVGVQTTGSYDRTLAEHWNGSVWSIVPTPNPTTTYSDDLNGVVAISATDVWVVGDYQSD